MDQANTTGLDIVPLLLPNNTNYGLNGLVKASLLCMYALTIVTSLGGNFIICSILLISKRLRIVTNIYIFNLSCCDILVITICVPFTAVTNLILYYWPFGHIVCPLVMYLQLVTVLQRSLLLVAMTCDKYYAIWQPLKRRLGTKWTKLLIGLLWCISAALSLPTAINSRVMYFPHEPGSNGLCLEQWSSHVARYWYSLFIMFIQYFIPLVILSVTYLHIGIIIWVKRTPGEADANRDERLAKSKRKTVKMMMAVVLAYAVCWLPLHILTLVGDLNPDIFNQVYMHTIWLFSHLLAVFNSTINPLVYFWMDSTYSCGLGYCARKILGTRTINNHWKMTFRVTNSSQQQSQVVHVSTSCGMANRFQEK